ncbi:hypothetical protein K469DRAFT_748856 [Zopfia rhizophila CBS 207.26]|uniref:Uncharacterized protein n=1 Tax=Zopfia rhizophila CBS 207.26 TaxID=1314779 RepID=A0A6A6EAP6_9PEZI|nr:hypothetical protein K469DRAFT_748856 [Zopfia rhizophila CBS 207.26]
MPLLDAIQLFLLDGISLGDPDTVSSREWHAMLQYVLHRDGIVNVYTSQNLERNSLWIFLTWKDAQSRSDFYQKSLGVGMMIPFMERPPQPFFLSEISDEALQSGANLSVHVFHFPGKIAEKVKVEFTEHWMQSPGNFGLWQEKDIVEKLYGGTSNDNIAFFGLIAPLKPSAKASGNFLVPVEPTQHEEFQLQLIPCTRHQHQDPAIVTPPKSIPGLLKADPWCYGSLQPDHTSFPDDDAYPVSLTFRPMLSLADDSWFFRDRDVPFPSCGIESWVDVIHLRLPRAFKELDPEITDGMCNVMRQQPGIRSLYWGLEEGDDRNLKLMTVWYDKSSSLQFKTRLAFKEVFPMNEPSDLLATSFATDSSLLLGSNKILEMVEFPLLGKINSAEKNAFLRYLHKFKSTMEIAMSHSDEQLVVDPFGPFWKEDQYSAGTCILLLQWTGLLQRQVWLRNFLADSYNVTGHLGQTLGLACPTVDSSTFTLHEIALHVPTTLAAKDGGGGGGGGDDDDNDESSEEMGF